MAAKVKVVSLREACIARGIDPDNTGYKSTKQKWLALDRIIPGVPDRIAPSEALRQRGDPRSARARMMYTRSSAANDAAQIAEGGMVAYVAAFCRLNNLMEAS
jgi:hypothetical protein